MTLTAEEQESRRSAVAFVRKSNELEGFKPLPELIALEEQYIAGVLTEEEFQLACIAEAMKLAPNKEWRITLPKKS